MDGADFTNLDFDAGLFCKLATGGCADVLAPFDVAAGDAPFADVAAGGPAAHQNAAFVIKQDDGYADRGVSEVDEATRRAGWPGETAAYGEG